MLSVGAMTHQTSDIPLFPMTAPEAFAVPGPTLAMLGPVLDDLAHVVAGIRADQLPAPTPCASFDVAALRDHVVGWVDFFGAAFADPRRTGPRPDPDAYRAASDPRDPADVVRAAAERLRGAVEGGVQDGEVVMSESRMTAPAALAMVIGEYVLHGWDLARATGQSWTPPDAAVTGSHEAFAGMITPEYRGGEHGFFDHEIDVPADAPALDRLLGFAGRDPAWTASA
jgi:uncharacterized protein (TIGR03086 family)